MSPLSHSDRTVRDLVAAADRQRRTREAFARVQWLAPWVAGGALAVAVTARWFGAAAWISWAALAAAFAVPAALWIVLRRERATTDAIALAVDTDAGLAGELRSAHWFEAQPERNEWAQFHLDRAVTHAGAVDWRALYPSSRSARSWIVTAVLAAGIAATGVRFPARRAAAEAATIDVGAVGAELPLDVQAKLTQLLAQMDDAALDPDAKRASLADLKKLMASLDPDMQKKLQAALEKKSLGNEQKPTTDLAKGEATEPKSLTGDLPDDLKWAQENQAARSAQSEDQKPPSNNAAAPQKSGETGSATMQAKAEPGGKPDAAAPIVREAASDEEGKKMMGGGGPMGGDSKPGAGKTNSNVKGAAEALLVAQKLRQELLEASADALGDNVDKEDLRRKTEQGKSSLGFTRAAAPRTVDPSRSAAPPPVPEPRRSLLFHYFIRR